MTSDEIKDKDVLAMSMTGWLKEVAYQLALLNEKPSPAKQQPNQSQRR